ncbi:MAG: hypothetical protein AAFN30_14200, partial [Actinomycetota bacterium]
LALDPTGMGPRAEAVLAPPLRARAAASAALSLTEATAELNRRHVVDLPDPRDLDAVIGLGGGYLRSADPAHELIFRAHHLPQLRLIERAGPRGAYLPVSVGPFRRGLGRDVRRRLGAAAWVAVRDDRSARYLTGHANRHRFPDLAACHLGRARPEPQSGEPGVVGVALRSLQHSDLGPQVVDLLTERGCKLRYGVQSSSGRTNDDRSFYRDQGWSGDQEDFGVLLDTDPRPSVVLAGRLHAALAAIAAGYPTVHLGYERKSAGAFADLGLDGYLVDAWAGEPSAVADLVMGLADDPEPYWERLSERFDPLADAWAELGRRVADVAEGSGRRGR